MTDLNTMAKQALTNYIIEVTGNRSIEKKLMRLKKADLLKKALSHKEINDNYNYIKSNGKVKAEKSVKLDKNLNIENLTATKNSITLKPMNCQGKIIDYTKPSLGRNIYIESLGIYTSPFLVQGNAKLDKSILIFDLLAIGSCGNCESCKVDCYARKAQVQYNGTYNKRAINTYMVKYDLNHLLIALKNQLSDSKAKIVRVHSSGDFLNQNEVNLWVLLAANNPGKQFYGYTKMNKILNFSQLDRLKNFNLIRSILPNGSKNFGSMSDYRALKKEYSDMKLCSYGIGPKAKMAHCGTTCKKCLKVSKMFFLEH